MDARSRPRLGARTILIVVALLLVSADREMRARADEVAARSSIEVAPRVILFEPEEVGNDVAESRHVVVTFTNGASVGGASVKFSDPVISRGFAIVANECRFRLTPAESCSITIASAPTTEGGYRGTLQIVSDAANSPHIVKLKGKGISAPLDFQKKLNFGDVKLDAAAPAMNLTLTNHGPTAIKFASVAASPPFNVIANDCDLLEPNAGVCTVRVEFAPRAAGMFKGLLELRDTAAKNPQHVKLVGRAN